MSTLLARKLAAHPTWLPRGAIEHLDLRRGRYFTGRKRHDLLSEAFAAAGLAFTRASQASRYGATGLIDYLAADQPRLNCHPVTLASLGLLLEGAMTPIVASNTEAFDNAYWTKTNCAATANADTAPDGAATAERLVPNTSTSSHNIKRASLAVATGNAYVASLFAKPGAGVTWISSGFYQNAAFRYVHYNLATGVVGNLTGGAGGGIAGLGNGWFRIATRYAVSTGSTTEIQTFAADANASANFAGDGTKYVSLWGAQLEKSPFSTAVATSYNAGVARAADRLARSIATPGHLCRVIAFRAASGLPASAQVIWQMDDGSEANRVRLVRDTSGVIRLIVTQASTETVNLALGTVDNESFNRVALAFDGTSFRATMNAAAVQSASAGMPGVTTERFGSGATAGDELCGHLAEISSYDGLADGGLVEKSRVFPRWLPTDGLNRPALLFNDYVNGRYWWNGLDYPTFETFLAAVGGTGTPGFFSVPWTDNTITTLYEGLSGNPTTDGRTHMLVQTDDGTSNNYERISAAAQSGIGGLGTEVRNGGTVQNGFGFNVFGRYSPFRVVTAFGSTPCVVGASNTIAVQTASVGTPPTVTTFRVGNSASGASANGGDCWKVAVFPNSLDATNVTALAAANLVCWVEGDSYAGGSGDVGVGQNLARTLQRMLVNLGVGGTTLAQIETRVLSEVVKYPGVPLVLWDGDANGYDTDIEVDKARYQNIIAALGHSRYVLIGPVPRVGLDAAAMARYKALCTWLKATLPAGQGIDPMDALITLMDPGTDGSAYINRECPSRLLQDGVHLTGTSMNAVLNQLVIPKLAAWATPE